MKKLLIVLVVLLSAMFIFADNISLLSQMTYGLFTNELDYAFQPNKKFASVDKTYISAGVSRLGAVSLNSSTSSSSFDFGMFKKINDRPWAFSFSNFATSNSIKGTSSADTVLTQTKTSYYNFNYFMIEGTAVTTIGDYVGSLTANIQLGDISKNYTDSKSTVTKTYDSDKNLTSQVTTKNAKRPFEVILYSPWYIATETGDVYVSATVDYENNTTSASSETVDKNGDVIASSSEVSSAGNIIDIGGSYSKSIDSPFFNDKNRTFTYTGNIDVKLTTLTFASSDTSSTTETKKKITYNPGVEIEANANATQLLSFAPTNWVTFKIKPGAGATVDMTINPTVNSASLVMSNSSGTVVDMSVEDVTNVATTGVYVGNSAITYSADRSKRTTAFEVYANLGTALKIQKPSSMLGFIFGSKMSACYRVESTKTLDSSLVYKNNKTSTEEKEENINTASDVSSKLTYAFATQFGVCFDFAENASIIAKVSGDVWNTGSFSVQACIGL